MTVLLETGIKYQRLTQVIVRMLLKVILEIIPNLHIFKNEDKTLHNKLITTTKELFLYKILANVVPQFIIGQM